MLVPGVEVEAEFLSLLGLGLDVDILEVVDGQGLSFLVVEQFGSLFSEFLDSVLGVVHSLLVSVGVGHSQVPVVLVVDV